MDSRNDSTENGVAEVEGKCDMLHIGGAPHFNVIVVLSRSGKHD